MPNKIQSEDALQKADPYANCFIEQWIRAGGKRDLSYPQSSLPEVSKDEAFVESSFMRSKS